MDKGFLNTGDSVKKGIEGLKSGSLLQNLASKVKNIDGKMLGKDGKPMKVHRRVKFVEGSITATDGAVGDGSSNSSTANNAATFSVGVVDGVGSSCTKEPVGDGCIPIEPANGPGVNHDSAVMNDTNVEAESKVGETQTQGMSFANVLNSTRVLPRVNFRFLVNEERVESHDTLLPMAAIEKVLCRFENTLVGYFLGKTIAFANVKSYVTNTWGKFGLQKLMKNDDGVYLFKFANKEGVDRVLERGPWLIRNSPIILNKWSHTLSLNRNEVNKVPVWIKLHKVPVVAYSEDGLSLIATQVGKPIMMDAFTSSMCVESWGRISFARALVELSADSELKSKVSMAVPNGDGGFTTEIIDVEYEWKPPHCGECKSFGHSLSDCPNHVKETVRNNINMAAKLSVPVDNHDEGFIEVRNRKNKGKNVASSSQSRPIGGIKLSKPKPNFWKPKVMTATNQSATIKDSDHKVQKEAFTSNVQTGTNSKSSNFGVLESLVDEDVLGSRHNDTGSQDQPKCDMESKVQLEATKPSTYLSPSNSSAKRGNPFSKVGDVVLSDSSDDDEVLEDHVGTLYSGSGRNEQSLYEQWKADTGDCSKYEDDFFDDCGLSPAQLKAAAKHDFRLG